MMPACELVQPTHESDVHHQYIIRSNPRSQIAVDAQYPPPSTPYWAEIFIDPVYLKLSSQSAKQGHTVSDRSITKHADHKLFRPSKIQAVDSVTTYLSKWNSLP